MWQDIKEDIKDDVKDVKKRMESFWHNSQKDWSRFWNYREPYVDFDEMSDEFIINVEIPGVEKTDIHISPSNSGLTIKAERRTHKEKEDKESYRTARSYVGFYTHIPLPEEADVDNIKARYGGGILEIKIPKLEGYNDENDIEIEDY